MSNCFGLSLNQGNLNTAAVPGQLVDQRTFEVVAPPSHFGLADHDGRCIVTRGRLQDFLPQVVADHGNCASAQFLRQTQVASALVPFFIAHRLSTCFGFHMQRNQFRLQSRCHASRSTDNLCSEGTRADADQYPFSGRPGAGNLMLTHIFMQIAVDALGGKP